MEDRLGLVETMKKKYGPNLDDVFNYLKRIKKEWIVYGLNYSQQLQDLKKLQEIILHIKISKSFMKRMTLLMFI